MRHRHTALALLAALALASAPVDAHDTPPTREIVAQATPDGLQILVTHREPAGERVELMKQRFDIDKDGHFSEAESKLAERVWARHVVAGLRFEVVGERPKILEPRLKLGIDEDGGLNAALLMQFSLPALPEGSERTLVVTMSEEDVPRAGVRIQGLEGLELARSARAPRVILPGQTQRVVFTRPAKNTDGNP